MGQSVLVGIRGTRQGDDLLLGLPEGMLRGQSHALEFLLQGFIIRAVEVADIPQGGENELTFLGAFLIQDPQSLAPQSRAFALPFAMQFRLQFPAQILP